MSNSCSGCHRVQGRGQWIGPDLSTIGTKYGRDELLRSVLNPSAAIGHGFRSLVVSLDDGRVLSGLPVEDSPERLVLKTAQGERLAIAPKQVEERKLEDTKLEINFGSQIRSYVLAPYRLIKDHRTKLGVGDVDRVLDGDFDALTHAYLVFRKTGKTVAADKDEPLD